MKNSLPPALFLMGPTASGKSALAVTLAQQLDTEIISVDSALVFKEMNIGTAKPNSEARGGIKHHLIDIIDPSEAFSTGQFRKQALAIMADIHARGKIPILVGGTMLYFKALTQGMADLPQANTDIRQQLDHELAQFGKQALHQRLTDIDPEAAAKIHPNDPQRIQRALEVYEITGTPLSQLIKASQHNTLPYQILKIIIAPENRPLLHQTIAQRFHTMLKQGFIDEVKTLYQRPDLHENLPAMRAVGYRQAWAYLQGHDDLNTMTEKAIIATRQLAKRQFTWLRKETEAKTFLSEAPDLIAAVSTEIDLFLNP
ncbi:MAG: tRNA (adenosine(37)-N6)-dimethylallyltransferase MiaA [Methylococcales bacterium]|nr:tRNA (adenosine(37)-N6)-dimethylallyltransferase MiaA [Methylococcales bacterium]